MSCRPRFIVAETAVYVLISLLMAVRLHAAGVVGDGSPASCTPGAFSAALVGGGTVSFDCGTGPHTIPIAATQVLALNTEIDGGGLITLQGDGLGDMIRVEAKTVSFSGLTFEQGNPAVRVTGGKVEIADSTFVDNGASCSPGPSYGALRFEEGAKSSTVANTIFSQNEACPFSGSSTGSVLFNDARLRVIGSIFIDNDAGAGILNEYKSKLEVRDSTFDAAGTAGIANWYASKLKVRGSTFRGCTIGIYALVDGKIQVENSTFAGNEAYAISTGGNARIKHSTFADNGTLGSGTYGGAIQIGGTGNTYPRLTLDANVFAGNLPNNCDTLSNYIIKASAPSLQYPGASCVHEKILTLDPMLDPGGLTDHGGPTETIAPLPGSPAIAATKCKSRVDQRGFSRKGVPDRMCTAGAYELNAIGPP